MSARISTYSCHLLQITRRLLAITVLTATPVLSHAEQAAGTQPGLNIGPSMEQSRDFLINAIRDGKAIVIAPLVQETRVLRGIDVSPTALETLWEKVDGTRSQFGLDRDAEFVAVLGEHMGMYVVEPGTYRLAASGYHTLSNANSRGYPVKDKLVDEGVGIVMLEDGKDWNWADNGYKWEGAKTQLTRVDTDYCSLVIAGSTICLNTSTATTYEDTVVEPGRWVSDSVRAETDALVAMPTLSPDKPFATFSIAAGEVLLLDAFIGANPNYLYDEDECVRITATKVGCRMKYVQLFLHSASAEDVRSAAAAYDDQQMRELLSKMRYRPYAISADNGGAGKWGTYYSRIMEQSKPPAP